MVDPFTGVLGVQYCTFLMERECGGSCTEETCQGCILGKQFRGVSLSSAVSKVMCMVRSNRLAGVTEEEGLIVEEKRGFQKQKRV